MGHINCWFVLMMRIYWVITYVDIIKKNTEILTDASKEVGPEVNIEKTKYMLLSHHQNSGQNGGIKTANRCFADVAQFKYLERQ
jgi:hypothetical protein